MSAGAAMIWPIHTIYVHDILGQSITVAGIVILINHVAGLIGNLLGGWMTDRWKSDRTILIGSIFSLVLTALLAWEQGFYYYSTIYAVLGLFSGMIYPSIVTTAMKSWEVDGRKAVNLIYVSQNAGMALGAALSGFIAYYSVHLVFLFNAMMIGMFIGVYHIGRRKMNRVVVERDTKSVRVHSPEGISTSPNVKVAFILLAIAFTVTWIGYAQWSSMISVVMLDLGHSYYQYSVLWTINGGLILLLQPFSSWFIRHYSRSLVRQMVIGTSFFSVSLFVIGYSTVWWHFALGMVVLTIGEVLVWPAVPAYISEKVPEHVKGRMLGLITGCGTLGRMIGPLIGGFVYENLSAFMAFVGLAAVTLGSAFLFHYQERWMNPINEGRNETNDTN